MAAMNVITLGAEAGERWRMDSGEPSDTAWIVLEAANDLGDTAAVEACRRVIDANLGGAPASPSDLRIVFDYFK
jgi:hypothetical protein